MPAPDAEFFRSVMSRLAAGVGVVSVVHDGVRYGMTVNSLTSVSLDPLLVLFCCQRDANFHDPVVETHRWAVSLLSSGHEDTSRWFATRASRGVDQFTDRDCFAGPLTGAPVLHGSIAWLECATWATYDGGDHTIVVGEVLGLEHGAEADPLVYYLAAYHSLHGAEPS